MNVAINGFGRIGRLVFRAIYERGLLDKGINVVAVNDIVPAETLAYLLKYDSVHRHFPAEVSAQGEELIIAGKHIKSLMLKDSPAALPWKDLQVDLVIEATGIFTKEQASRGHLEAGAKNVLITAPSGDADINVVYGVNHQQIDLSQHALISGVSCTTNCATPLAHVLQKEGIGIVEGLLTTMHSYTASQALVDAPNKKEPRLGRNAANNLVPASTGAAEAICAVIPELQGKLTGMAVRVPTPTVSLVDLTIRTEKATSYAEITDLMRKASESYLQGVLGVTSDPVVSTDFIHDPRSSIFDIEAGIELNSNFFKLISWYDNEWGYSNRIADLVEHIASL